MNTATNGYSVTMRELIPLLVSAFRFNFPILLQSAPGIGKTSGVKQAAALAGIDVIFDHPVTAEPSDYKGLAFPSADKKSAQFLPYGLLHRMIYATKPLIVFFDDIGGAPQSVQMAIAQIIQEKKINGHVISEHVRFVAATNRRQDNAGSNALITMLLSRMNAILEVIVDAPAWIEWGIGANIPIVQLAYIRRFPDHLMQFDPKVRDVQNFACPRTHEKLAQWINAGVESRAIWNGCIGQKVGVHFAAFYDTWKTLGSLPDTIAKGGQPTPEQSTLLLKPDVQYMVSAALANIASKGNIHHVAKFLKSLPVEFTEFFYVDAGTRNPDIKNTPGYIDHVIKNQVTL